jgi:Helix-turn-helix domain
MQTGQPFNPFRLFTGIFIPEGLVRATGISPGAKLAYGRLVRYAGENGKCYPSVDSLAAEIGVGARQAQKYLANLERAKLIRRVRRFSGGGQTSNAFEFLWHPVFQEGVNDRSGKGVNDNSPRGVNESSPEESQIEESHAEESHNGDLDYPPTNRKKRDSRLESLPPAVCKQYPRLQEAVADYMAAPGEERITPSARLVVDIMNAAGGASEDEVIACLRCLREERGLRPGAKNGPRHFNWFKTVVADYFAQKRDRDLVTGNGPAAAVAGALPTEVFQSLTEVLE